LSVSQYAPLLWHLCGVPKNPNSKAPHATQPANERGSRSVLVNSNDSARWLTLADAVLKRANEAVTETPEKEQGRIKPRTHRKAA